MSELYALPEGWEWRNINDIIQKTKNKIPKNEPNREFTYIDISSIDNSLFSIVSPKRLTGNEAPSRAKKEVIRNDIIFATTRPNLKNIAIIKDEYDNPIASTGFCILRVNEQSEFQYLFFYLLSNIFYKQVEKNIRGAQYPAISDKDVKTINIPLPPLKEQKRIVAKLDNLFTKIDQSIALHQKNIDEVEGFMGSVLSETFTELETKYGTNTLSSIVKINSGIALPKIFKGIESAKGEFDFFKVAQMNNDNKIMKNANLKFTHQEAIEHKIKLFPKGSILIPKRGGAILTNKKRILINDASYDSNIMGLKADNSLISDDFLFAYLNSIDLKNFIDTTTIPQLNNKHIDMMKLSIPPLKVQQKTVIYLNNISEKTEAIKTIQKEKMQSLKALKASILDRAFRGEL